MTALDGLLTWKDFVFHSDYSLYAGIFLGIVLTLLFMYFINSLPAFAIQEK